LSRAAEQPEDKSAEQACVEASLGGQARERSVSEARRQKIRREGDSRREIRSKPLRLVAPQPAPGEDHPAPATGWCGLTNARFHCNQPSSLRLSLPRAVFTLARPTPRVPRQVLSFFPRPPSDTSDSAMPSRR